MAVARNACCSSVSFEFRSTGVLANHLSCLGEGIVWRNLVLAASSPNGSGLYQSYKTNVMRSLLNLLRIKGLYVFLALLAYPQEALHKRHLVYCVRDVSCLHQHWSGTPILMQTTDITCTQYTKCRLVSPPGDE
jgi:hypothetical protein